jgi:hypothetical protein
MLRWEDNIKWFSIKFSVRVYNIFTSLRMGISCRLLWARLHMTGKFLSSLQSIAFSRRIFFGSIKIGWLLALRFTQVPALFLHSRRAVAEDVILPTAAILQLTSEATISSRVPVQKGFLCADCWVILQHVGQVAVICHLLHFTHTTTAPEWNTAVASNQSKI